MASLRPRTPPTTWAMQSRAAATSDRPQDSSMVLLRPRSPPTTRAMRARGAASSDRIPLDVLFDALLHLQVKDLCRLRAVCRSWCALLSDRIFITAHAARHSGPLFLAKFRDEKTAIYIVDLSGNVVKRITTGASDVPSYWLLRISLDLACLSSHQNRCRVLNPATGAVHILPKSPAAVHVNRVSLRHPYTIFAIGWVASTGQHKVLRVFNRPSLAKGHQQFFEVFTINGGTDHAQWRGQQNPGLFVEESSGTVVDGVVYFLTSTLYDDVDNGIRPDYILPFDLGREEWRRDLRGPISTNVEYKKVFFYRRPELALAELKGSLVLADHHHQPFTMDLWFLVDFQNGLWVKEYHIHTQPINSKSLKPLLVLGDERLIFYLAQTGRLFIYNPGNKTFAALDMRRLHSVGVYTGNLLSLQ